MAHTPRPWIIGSKVHIGWRIDSVVPQEGKTEFDAPALPVAIVPEKEDAELIVKLANADLHQAIAKAEGE